MQQYASPSNTDSLKLPGLLVAVCCAASFDPLCVAVTQAAALDLPGNVGASLDEAAWITVLYTAGKAVGFLLCPPMVARWHLKSTLQSAFLGAIMALIGLQANLSVFGLVFLRGVQGIIAGVLTATAFAIVISVVPKHKQPLAQGLWGMTITMGPAVWAAWGGILCDSVGWRGACMMALPILVSGAWACDYAVPSRPWAHAKPTSFDYGGLLGFFALSVAWEFLSAQATRFNGTDVTWMVPLCLSAAGGVLFWMIWQHVKNNTNPIVHRGPFLRPEFNFACLSACIAGYGAAGSAMLAPMYVRRLFGFAARDAGWLQMPSVLPIGLGLTFSVLATTRKWVHPMTLIITGMLGFVGALLLWSQATWQVDMAFVSAVVGLRGVALGLMAVPTAIVAFTHLRGMDAVYASGYYQLARQYGASLATLSLTWRLAESQARFRYNIGLHLLPGDPGVLQRLYTSGEALTERGLAEGQINAAGMAQGAKALSEQVLILAYNACFMELAVVYGVLMTAVVIYRLATIPQQKHDLVEKTGGTS